MQTRSFIGMDVHKATISISIAEDGRNGPVRFLGVIPNVPEDIAKMAKRLSRHGELDFCYEAGGVRIRHLPPAHGAWPSVYGRRDVDGAHSGCGCPRT